LALDRVLLVLLVLLLLGFNFQAITLGLLVLALVFLGGMLHYGSLSGRDVLSRPSYF